VAYGGTGSTSFDPNRLIYSIESDSKTVLTGGHYVDSTHVAIGCSDIPEEEAPTFLVEGASWFNGDVAINSGNVTINKNNAGTTGGDLSVAGTATISGALTANSTAYIKDILTLNNDIYYQYTYYNTEDGSLVTTSKPAISFSAGEDENGASIGIGGKVVIINSGEGASAIIPKTLDGKLERNTYLGSGKKIYLYPGTDTSITPSPLIIHRPINIPNRDMTTLEGESQIRSPQIYREGGNGNWWEGRDLALVRAGFPLNEKNSQFPTKSAAGYIPVISA
jgi:hypothetical protein